MAKRILQMTALFLIVVAVIPTGSLSQITMEPGKFTIEPRNEKVVVGKYTLGPKEGRRPTDGVLLLALSGVFCP